ncbi:efflux RND transporter periplasmic adaptor subunit [Altererythrobacter sp. KTW20L]|uniref:efflux RND transporter periplasmic adaptor subunit n=1 Tax=Altererythrobacter sp. KTW20L TaxID=2942210 RepID=UPI0020BDBA26|nr:efflux RND transporter periplasmic adaptor subunit [Altererythrobacter sp. KTW20L]MCL6252346.1 efflux RND transporter periplasmic adaptor subunit [Altererythrobacter sp. KTW20L]
MLERLKRWRWAVLVALLMVAGLAFAFWPTATLVDVAEVTRGPMAVGVTDDGVTRAEDVYIVAAPVTGYLSRIELEAGDEVVAGQLISRMTSRLSAPLDPRSEQDLRGALAAAQAATAGSEAALGQAQRDLARSEELSQRGFLPLAQLEAARTRVSTEQARVQQSRAEANRLRALLAQPQGPGAGAPVPVRAPAAGSVLSVLRESEGVIAEGTELLAIGNPQSIEVVVDLLSREAVRVGPGNPVEITQWGGPDPLAGSVLRIEPFGRLKVSALGIEEQRVNVIIGFTGAAAAAAARLGHGYQLDATIILWQSDDVLRVPIGALFRGGDGGWRVFVEKGGRAREIAVSIGHLNDEFAEVTGGLEAGDQVVLNPANSLRAEDRIRAR